MLHQDVTAKSPTAKLAADAISMRALLLPFGFDSIPARRHLFADNSDFTAKIVLLERIVWFERADGKKEDPKENHAWFIWTRPRQAEVPIIRYVPSDEGAEQAS